MNKELSSSLVEDEKILVIDDDEVLASTLDRALSRRGLLVSVAHNESEALAACQNQSFDKVLLDLKLAEGSGLQLIPKLLALQSQLKIVMLTGYSSIPTAVQAIKLGAINYLSKPVDIEEVLFAFDTKADLDENGVDISPPSVDRLEWEHIQRVLHEHDGNISATARALGMHRRTLQRKLQKKPVKR